MSEIAPSSSSAEALFVELIALSPADDLPARSDYANVDGSLNEDDIRADLEERRREAASAPAPAWNREHSSGSDSSFKASPCSFKRNISDDGAGPSMVTNVPKRRAVRTEVREETPEELLSTDDEVEADEDEGAPPPLRAPPPSFVPVHVDGFQSADAFDGPREGMAFKLGPAGLGYYPDVGGAPTISVDDLQQAIRQAESARADPLTPSPKPSPGMGFARTRDTSFTTSMYSRALASEARLGQGPPLQFRAARPKAGPLGSPAGPLGSPARPKTP